MANTSGSATEDARPSSRRRRAEGLAAPAPADATALPARTRYELGAEVARGGMGAVLRARDPTIRRGVAMKILLGEGTGEAAARFIEEAQVTGQLEHPGIVPVYDLGRGDDGQPFYTMKFVKGATLRAVLEGLRDRDPRLLDDYPLARLLTIFQKICDAVAFAHSHGVIHRDLKPDNIMIGDFGEVLVMDWGLAKIVGDRVDTTAVPDAHSAGAVAAGASGRATPPDMPRSAISSSRRDQGDTARTMSGDVLGSPNFMSPEQANGEIDRIDARSDLFALGGILYNILSLEMPFRGRDLARVLDRVRRVDIAPPIRATSGGGRLPHLPGGRVPAALSAVAMKAMARDPAARYQTVPDLQRDIEAYQNGFATSVEHAGALKQLALFIQRNKAVSVTVAAGLAVLAAVAAGFLVRVTHERNVARAERNRAEAALQDLRRAAPTLINQAQAAIERGHFDEALARIDFALQIDPQNADYLLLKAQVLQADVRLARAARAFRQVLDLGPHAAALKNLALCEQLLRENPNPNEIDLVSLRALYEQLTGEGRVTQAVPLGLKLGIGRSGIDKLLQARLEGWRRLAGWEKMPEAKRVIRNPDGTLALSFDGLPLTELSSLKGLPVVELNLNRTPVSDLRPLADMRLTRLMMSEAPVEDLSPLRGMPLRSLFVWKCHRLRDIEPLRGMPLEELNVGQTDVTDYRPLQGCPLKTLLMECQAVTNLDALAGLPLEKLVVQVCRDLTDISSLRSMPRLRTLELARCEKIRDLTPLAACRELERLSIPRGATNLAFLASLGRLRMLGYEILTENWTVDEFLDRRYPGDPQRTGRVALVRRTRAAFEAAGQAEVRPDQIKVLEDGTLDLRFAYMKCITNLAPFATLPISLLDIAGTSIRDLAPLAGQPLRRLDLHDTAVADLTPLAACPTLTELHVWRTPVSDLMPLKGLPLVALFAGSTSVSDLAPLAGLPLRKLALDKSAVTDLQPLVACPRLEYLTIPYDAKNVEKLRELKHLKRLSTRWEGPTDGRPAQSVEEFWREREGG